MTISDSFPENRVVMPLKRVSWPAVFGGTFVALGMELVFAAFGLFIGFTLNSGGGITAWSEAWFFVTCFFSLLAGAYVTARLAENVSGSGALHGLVTWGLTAMVTFALMVWMSWGIVGTSLAAVRTAAVANAAPVTTTQPANNVNAPQAAAIAAGDASTISLVIFGGLLCGLVASVIGGSMDPMKRRVLTTRQTAPAI